MQFLTPSTPNAIIGFAIVCAFYAGVWWFLGRGDSGSVFTLYSPPRGISPAMMRFIWKERFDDRALWACVLGLVSKKVAVLQQEKGKTFLRAVTKPKEQVSLSKDESLLAEALFGPHLGRRAPVDISAPKIAAAIWQVSRHFHETVAGKWFSTNRRHLLVGCGLSFAVIALTANPVSFEQFAALVLPFAVLAPAGYYGFFVVLRIVDFFRALRRHIRGAVLGRAIILFGMLAPCLAAVAMGAVLLGTHFPMVTMPLTLCLVAVNASSLLWMKFPTDDGRILLREIEGFREFLLSVERLPKDRFEGPSNQAGIYEKYLPYAVALEIEQVWCEQFVALQSAFHEEAAMFGVRPFYLGMWDGEPVEITYFPTDSRSH